MAIAATLQKYLDDQGVSYQLVPHEQTTTSEATAKTSHISGDSLAKGVLLRDQQGYWLAVLPTSRHARLTDLRDDLGERLDLASEQEIATVFRDCSRGAIPPFGECYGLDMVVDTSIDQQPDIYCEGGDHATLIRMSQAEFSRLNGRARHASFSSETER